MKPHLDWTCVYWIHQELWENSHRPTHKHTKLDSPRSTHGWSWPPEDESQWISSPCDLISNYEIVHKCQFLSDFHEMFWTFPCSPEDEPFSLLWPPRCFLQHHPQERLQGFTSLQVGLSWRLQSLGDAGEQTDRQMSPSKRIQGLNMKPTLIQIKPVRFSHRLAVSGTKGWSWTGTCRRTNTCQQVML